ncbi:MAG TPA: triose-phosphate isomerase [Chitinophagales bacterium]|nr:triose-phosphate isomerase [Chitinophagales bacterium]
MRKKIVAGNWKMNLDITEAAELLAAIDAGLRSDKCDVLLFPSLVLIGDLMDMYEGERIVFGAQNCSNKESGAYTGEVSAAQLASVGIELVLVGHSERREYFGETNQMLKEKLQLAIKHEVTPVFCCGEPKAIREAGTQQQYVKQQLEETLFDFSPAAIAEIIIAYEPVWAIGTGLNATPGQAQEMHAFIRAEIAAKFGDKVAAEMPILYGGSCKPDNAKALFACPDVDGGLVGGASLNAKDFLEIVKAASY